MYKELNGREWPSEKAYLNFKKISKKNFRASLALEDYMDSTGDNRKEIKEIFRLVGEYYKRKNNLNANELIDFSNRMSAHYENIFDIIGRENFIFYDDGDVEYIWPKQEK